MINSVIVYRLLYVAFTILVILFSYSRIRITIKGLQPNVTKNVCILCISLTVACFASIRPLEFPDTMEYLSVYQKIGSPESYLKTLYIVGVRSYNLETGFVFLMAICKSLFDFRSFLFIAAFINSMITISATVKITSLLKERQNKLMPITFEENAQDCSIKKEIAIFFAFYALHYSCLAIRAGLSIAICLVSFYMMLKDRKLLSFIFLFIAIKMQTMSILFLFALLYIMFKNKVSIKMRGMKIRITEICIIICLLSLLFNLGAIIIDDIVKIIFKIFSDYNIAGFSGYLVGLDKHVGLKDWLTVIVIGISLIMINRQNESINNIVKLLIIGLFITSFLYSIRAINRAADYFYCLLLPLISSYSVSKNNTAVLLYMNYLLLPLLLGIQIAYTL